MHYVAHLCKDKKLKNLLERQGSFQLKKKRDLHLRLCASIISQQLSVTVAAILYKRFLNLYNSTSPGALQISETPIELLRSVGLSAAKARYVLNVATFAMEQGITAQKLNPMDDEAVIAYITQIKGVGRWTAEMLMIFALGREDVFSADDLVIQTAMRHVYKLDNTDKKSFRQQMLRISQKWSPYRSYACLHLWAWKDGKEGI